MTVVDTLGSVLTSIGGVSVNQGKSARLTAVKVLPAIEFFRISSLGNFTMAGVLINSVDRFQVNMAAATYAALETLYGQVQGKLDNNRTDFIISIPLGINVEGHDTHPPTFWMSADWLIISAAVGGIPYITGRLLATGQLTSYGSGAGVDDGSLRKGLLKSYSVLTAGQYSGTSNITINSKTDAHSNNCVVDNITGLMWSRYYSQSVGPASAGTLPWTTNGNGEGIFTYCAAANAASLSGYSDWRIPNDTELLSIRDMEAPTAVPDTTAFPDSPSIIWSSTTTPDSATAALRVTFTSNGICAQETKTVGRNVMLVRGG